MRLLLIPPLGSLPLSFLEKKVLDVEGKHKEELQGIKAEKLEMQGLLSRQTQLIQELEQHLATASANNTVLQRQQASLMDTVHQLLSLVSQCNRQYCGVWWGRAGSGCLGVGPKQWPSSLGARLGECRGAAPQLSSCPTTL